MSKEKPAQTHRVNKHLEKEKEQTRLCSAVLFGMLSEEGHCCSQTLVFQGMATLLLKHTSCLMPEEFIKICLSVLSQAADFAVGVKEHC